MIPRHRVSRTGIDLLKRFEGLRSRAAQLPSGGWTIGHGHTLTAREGARVSDADAEALLIYDLIPVAQAICDTVHAPLSQGQFDALCSFVFNIGVDNFRQSSVLRRLNEGAPLRAACAMEMWRKAEIGGELVVVDALVRRRAAEKALFLALEDGAQVTAPSALLPPFLDAHATALVPTDEPRPANAVLEGQHLVLAEAAAQEEPEPGPATRPEDAATPAEEDPPSPAKAAAEAVSARLEILLAEPPPSPPEPETSREVRPQADFAPPITATLEPPEPPGPTTAVAEPDQPPAPVEADRPAAPSDPVGDAVAEALAALPDDRPFAPAGGEAPYRFRQPIAARPRHAPRGLPSLIVLAVTGLAFFAGGLVWGLNATSSALDGVITPQLVGLLAGLAGMLMFCASVYWLLERLGRAAEGSDDEG